jgi:hypothetical protein
MKEEEGLRRKKEKKELLDCVTQFYCPKTWAERPSGPRSVGGQRDLVIMTTGLSWLGPRM